MAKLFVICGHGAGDSGAVGNDFKEADQVRKLGKKIKELGGNNVMLGDVSRNFYKDKGILSLNISKDYKICELHMDSSPDEKAKGAHVIIKKRFKEDEYDKALAKFLGDMFPGRSSKIVGRSDLANVNRAATKGYNYRLVECGFISNADDAKKFNDNIEKIAKGILESFGIKAGSSTGNQKPSKPTKPDKPSGGYTGNSIVDYLDSIGKDSSFAARKKYAAQYGIKNYTGTASQNTKLLNAMRGGSKPVGASYYPAFNSSSIVDGLKKIGVNSSFSSRKKIAKANGIRNYSGTASQNEKLCDLAKKGKLRKA